MPHLLMIYSNENAGPQPGTEAFKTMTSQFRQLSRELDNSGVLIAGDPLESITTTTAVRVRGGKHLITDEQYNSNQETLIGYYLLNCKNTKEAIYYATQIPTAAYGRIEIINQFFYDSLSNSEPQVRLYS